MRKYFFFIVLSIFFLTFFYNSLDILAQTKMSLKQCETVFLKNNLQLLAEKYNIDVSRAAVVQAKIWELPQLSGDINLYHPNQRQLFDIDSNGEKAVAIEQLFYLGGKKAKEVEFAKSNVEIAELEYEQLVLNLLFELKSNYYAIYFNQRKTHSINQLIEQVDTLIDSYQTQAEKGNIAMKEVVRLKSMVFGLQNDLAEIKTNMIENQRVLKVLLNSNENIETELDENVLDEKLRKELLLNENDLLEKVKSNNPEYLTMLKLLESDELYLKWQESLSIPDLTIGVGYDQNGGAFHNQFNLSFGIPIPLWDRNAGNTQIAESKVSQTKLRIDQNINEFKSKVNSAIATYDFQYKQFIKNQAITKKFEEVYGGIFKNFQKRNIALIEFTDFVESYINSVLYLNEQKKQLTLSIETINYLVNDKEN